MERRRTGPGVTMSKTYQKGRDGIYRVSFDSLAELVEASSEWHVQPVNSQLWYNMATRRDSFTNYYDMARVKRELECPPPCSAHVEDVKHVIDSKIDTPMTVRRLVSRRDDGDELDPGAWIRREADGWSRIEKRNAPKRVIRIACNASVNAGRSPEDLYFRGAAATALADVLEAQGNSVEIVLFGCNLNLWGDDDVMAVISATIKRPDMPLDRDTVALALSEIGFYRTLLFCTKVVAAGKHKAHGSLGRPSALPAVDAEGFDIVIDHDVFTLEDATRVVEKYASGCNLVASMAE